MKNHSRISFYSILILLMINMVTLDAQRAEGKWSTEKAWKWYNANPWICGFNYIPSNAINYTAMWDKTSFSPETIEKELTLAEETGFNTVRVVLQFIVWEDDSLYFRDVFGTFLSICARHKMKVIPAFFDDCVFGTNVDPSPGKQPEPFEGWYAWAWSPSPGHTIVADSTTWPRLEKYVKDITRTFSNDPSILLWDLFNEPRNTTLPLVRNVFRWAREINPSQPLTICIFGDQKLQNIISANSDIITFHNYSPKTDVEKTIMSLKQFNRPVICTEWLNRPFGSTVESVLPLLFEENIGCLHWGLVNGKTQTDLPWGHRPGDGPYNRIWQHDLYTQDLKMYSPYEFEVFKTLISKSKERQRKTVK